MHRRISSLALLLVAVAAGCSAPPAVDVVRVDPGSYEAAFDAALAVAASNRLAAVVRDRRSGLIEAGPTVAASLLEPWHDPGATLGERVERTIQHYRRRARFEFIPAGAAPREDDDASLSGADILGLEPAALDRTTWSGPLELRVRVFLEQSHRPGLRPDTWSRLLTTYTDIVTPGADADRREREWDELSLFGRFDDDPDERRRSRGTVLAAVWTPVVRDTAFEQRLLAEVDERLRD